jgi:large subunit ribosomal protein L21
MYAVIRTGGKQYRVAPGDTLKLERTAHENGSIEFGDVLAVSGKEGTFESSLDGAKVTGTVLGEGRGEKILVFKLKRKKQYKKMQGHRQNYVEVRINEIFVNGESLKAEATPEKAEPRHGTKSAAKSKSKAELQAEPHAELQTESLK